MIPARVLVDRIILGRKCRPGDVIELSTEDQVSFLTRHGVIERVATTDSRGVPDERKRPRRKRAADG